ncbi:MAG: aminoglycoside phosphotransferase family protein [Oceanococcaceae bacterium]
MDESQRGDQRLSSLEGWLAEILPGASAPVPASSDASFRRYFRTECDGTSFILMDAPPAQEDCRPFIAVAAWMEASSLPAPRVLQQDLEQGFLLLDDLGRQTMLDALRQAESEQQSAYYQSALRLLVQLQAADRGAPAELPPYTEALLDREMDLFRDWYLLRLREVPWGPDEEGHWQSLKQYLLEAIAPQPQGVVHRDYHSRNLMLRPDGQLGMLDFQDAVRGSLCYDLISLLRDCYWDLGAQAYSAHKASYLQLAQSAGLLGPEVDLPQLSAWCDPMAVQRHLKAAGIFARLWLRDGKAGYLDDIPRTLGYIRAVCAQAQAPALRWLGQSLDQWQAAA